MLQCNLIGINQDIDLELKACNSVGCASANSHLNVPKLDSFQAGLHLNLLFFNLKNLNLNETINEFIPGFEIAYSVLVLF